MKEAEWNKEAMEYAEKMCSHPGFRTRKKTSETRINEAKRRISD
jgi:hypothetical protein